MVLREMRQLIVLYLHGLGFIGLQGYHANRNWSKAAREQPQLWWQWLQKASTRPPLISANPFIFGVLSLLPVRLDGHALPFTPCPGPEVTGHSP